MGGLIHLYAVGSSPSGDDPLKKKEFEVLKNVVRKAAFGAGYLAGRTHGTRTELRRDLEGYYHRGFAEGRAAELAVGPDCGRCGLTRSEDNSHRFSRKRPDRCFSCDWRDSHPESEALSGPDCPCDRGAGCGGECLSPSY